MRARAYSKFLSEVPLRQPEDGQYRPKHVVVHYIVIKYTSCDTVVFDYMPFSKFHINTVQALPFYLFKKDFTIEGILFT